MLGHFHSKSDWAGLYCGAAEYVSIQPIKLSGENGTTPIL